MTKRPVALLLTLGMIAVSLAGCVRGHTPEPSGGDSIPASENREESAATSKGQISKTGEDTKMTTTTALKRTTAPAAESHVVYTTVNNGFETYRIARPAKNLTVVQAADFGMSVSNMDNYQPFSAILYYCEEHPNTEVVFQKGTYRFKEGHSRLVLNKLKNIKFSFNGASFLMRGPLFGINDCEGVEINGLDVRWDWDYDRLTDAVKCTHVSENSDGFTVELEFLERTSVTQAELNKMKFKQMSQVDPVTYTCGAGAAHKEIYLGEYYGRGSGIKTRTVLGGNKVRLVYETPAQNASLRQIKAGDTLMLYHRVYDWHCINVSNSSHVTFDRTNIYGAGGMAYCCFGARTKYIQWLNCKITKDPQRSDVHVSATADGIHLIKCGGYINIQDCEIAYQGDDGLNIGTVCAIVDEVKDAHSMEVRVGGDSKFNCSVGDQLEVRTNEFKKLNNVKLTVTDIREGIDSAYNVLTFKEEIPAEVTANYILSNPAIANGHFLVKNCIFRENRARGITLSSGNGTVEGCRFYKTQLGGIRAGCDISSSSWQEGAGIDNLCIKRNTFEGCNVTYTWYAWAAVSVINALNKQTLRYPAVTNLTVSGNTFINTPNYAITLQNVKKATVSGNTIRNTAELPATGDARGCIMLDTDWSISVTDNIWEKSAAVPNPVMWKLRYTAEKELTQSGNVIR